VRALLFAPILLLGSTRLAGAWGVAYPPADAGTARAPIVYLHGMWATPEDSCPLLEHAATARGFLVCPRGNSPSPPEGRMWTGTYATVAPSLHGALNAASALSAGALDRNASGTLVGYSNGAYFAAEIAMHEPGRWTGLVLLSMHLDLDADRLRAVLGAGDRDGARDTMRVQAEHLAAEGLPTRFMSLGDVGHELPIPPGVDRVLADALAWVAQP
jgi:pimeloyl-ACP methyl ester carboxylesterase